MDKNACLTYFWQKMKSSWVKAVFNFGDLCSCVGMLQFIVVDHNRDRAYESMMPLLSFSQKCF